MRLPGSRTLSTAAALTVCAVAPAHAATRTATDHANFVRFRLQGRALTLRPLVNDRALWGERVRAVCTTARHRMALGSGAWPRHARTLTIRLSVDISRTARACRLESAPTRVTIAHVAFAPR